MRNLQSNAATEPPISVAGLSKSFGEQMVLDHVGLAVAHGETVAVLGQSGTGKSVLLKLLIGLYAPDAGTIRIRGRDIARLTTRELNEVRKRVGFLFQQAALYDSLTIEENVAFPLRRHTHMPPAELRERVRELLASVGLNNEVNKLPSQISGGMQKRVGMARALALDPELLLLDEPTAGLDPITATEIAKLVRELQQQREVASVVVTHDLHHAEAFADRFIVLHQGHVVMEGTFEELKRSRDPFVARFLEAA